ncbi:hypothetical protein Hanom_Chr06g00482661 [Helianthus anomalus]
MIDKFMLYEDLRIGPKFFISNRAKNFFVIFGDGPVPAAASHASLVVTLNSTSSASPNGLDLTNQ